MNAAPRQSPKVWMVRPKKWISGCNSEVVQGIHHSPVDPGLEVEMVPEAAAGASNVADDLALLDRSAHRSAEARLVRVTRGERAGVLDAGEVAVAAGGRLGLHQDDLARRGGVDRRAGRDADVDARVAGLPGARLAEGRGDRAVDRPDQPARAGLDRPAGDRAGVTRQARLDLRRLL